MAETKTYGITLEVAQAHLEAWMEAELEVTTHQSYMLDNMNLTMADLGTIRNTIDYWNNKVMELKKIQDSGGRNRMYRAVPRDY